jgi:hypothetical protein
MADTSGEGAALASVFSVGVGSASLWGGGHDMLGPPFGLSSIGRHGHNQPLWLGARHLRALLWPLFVYPKWSQPATMMAATTGEGAVLDPVLFVGVGSASYYVGEHDS